MKTASSEAIPSNASGTSTSRGRASGALILPATAESTWTRSVETGSGGVAVYLRTATKESAVSTQSASCVAVVSKLEADGWVHQKTLSDLGASGNDDSRPGLRELLALANAGAIGAVVVSDLARLSRSVKSQIQVLQFLQKHGVQVFTPDGAITETLLSSVPMKYSPDPSPQNSPSPTATC